jgi:hypothetical protein
MEFTYTKGAHELIFITPTLATTLRTRKYNFNSISIIWLRYRIGVKW